MLSPNRVVYGREGRVTPLWVWLLQRVSAVLLGPLVLIHVCISGAARNFWVDGSLLLVILIHGYIGLWRLTVSRSGAPASPPAQAAMAFLILCMATLGVFIVRALW